MFRKLKIKLIMINMIFTGVVLVAVFVSIYVFMRDGSKQQSLNLMTIVAREERVSISTADGKNSRILSECFYIKISPRGIIWEISPNLLISREDAVGIVQRILEQGRSTGTTKYYNLDLRFLAVPKNYGFILVFLDRSHESEVLNRLVLISVVIGIASLLLVFIISFYLAGKALIPVKMAWEKQKAFVADASHELRTPLAVINANLDLIMSNPKDTVESQSKWLGYMKSEIKRMSRLVDDLLFLARTDSNKINLEIKDFNLSTALIQTVLPFEPIAANSYINIETDIQDDVMFRGDESRIKQMVAILIDNALKYTPDNGKVQLKMRREGNFIVISVSDTGEGIPPEHIGKIFERFYRVDKSRSRERGGTGLGLSIANSIVKEHKGSITVESTVGKGSTFTVRLPTH